MSQPGRFVHIWLTLSCHQPMPCLACSTVYYFNLHCIVALITCITCHFNVHCHHLASSPLGQMVQCHQTEGESHSGGICHKSGLLFPCGLLPGVFSALYMIIMLHCMLTDIVCISPVILMYAVTPWCVGHQIKGPSVTTRCRVNPLLMALTQPRPFVPMRLAPRCRQPII